MKKIDQVFFRLQSERGAVLVFVAMLLFVLIGVSAFAIDIGYLYVVRNELQNAADAGALAGAATLYNEDGTQILETANNVALQSAAFNQTGNTPVNVTAVDRGHYSFGSRTFTPNPSLQPVPLWDVTDEELDANTDFINAVRVQTSRADAPSFFGRIFGYLQYAVNAEAVAYLGYAGTLEPHDVDQPIAICQQAIKMDSYTCGVGRMINSGSNTGHQTGGWTNFSQPCDTASSATVRPLICASGNPEAITLGLGMGSTGGQEQTAFDRFYDCWKSWLASHGNVPWPIKLAVIDCSGNNVSPCSEVVGSVDVNVIWMTQTDKNQMREVPTQMADWTCRQDCASAGDTAAVGQCCWNDFVSRFNLEDILNGSDAFYEDKTIYFLPDCSPHIPRGRTGGRNFGVMARWPVLVQ